MNRSKSLVAVGVVSCLLLSSLIVPMPANTTRAQPADSPWPMFGQNPQRTGQSPYTGPQVPYPGWSVSTRIQGSSPSIDTDGTAWASDDSCDKAAPDIIGPSDGLLVPHRSDPDLCENEPFTIRWVHQCDACKYDVQIALDRDFTELVEASRLRYEPPDKADAGYVVEGGELKCGIDYYWRIRSVEVRAGREVRSCWSPSRTVTVSLPIATGVRLVSPESGATNIPRTNISFTWNMSVGVDSYSFVLSRNADLSDPSETKEGLTYTAYTYTGANLVYDTPYYWRVTAIKDGVPMSLAVGVFRTLPDPSPPPPPSVVGVKAGRWIKVEYTFTGWPADQPHPDWVKLEFLTVEGTSADVRVTMRMSDGTEQVDTVPVRVGGSGAALGLSGFVISANRTTGDHVYMTGYGYAAVEGETTGIYAGANRTAVYTSFEQHGVQLTYYWDKQTGVMVEATTVHGNMTMTATTTGTNIWKADHRGPPWWLWLIVAAAAGVAVVIYLKKRGYAREPHHNEDG